MTTRDLFDFYARFRFILPLDLWGAFTQVASMVAEASLANLQPGQANHTISAEEAAKGRKANSSSLLKLAEIQEVLHKVIIGAVRYDNGEEVIEIPAREIAAAAVAFVRVEERRRLNQGKGNPAPVKSDAQGRRSGRRDLLRRIESSPVIDVQSQVATERTVAPAAEVSAPASTAQPTGTG